MIKNITQKSLSIIIIIIIAIIMIIKSERKRTIIAYIFAGLTNCNTK